MVSCGTKPPACAAVIRLLHVVLVPGSVLTQAAMILASVLIFALYGFAQMFVLRGAAAPVV